MRNLILPLLLTGCEFVDDIEDLVNPSPGELKQLADGDVILGQLPADPKDALSTDVLYGEDLEALQQALFDLRIGSVATSELADDRYEEKWVFFDGDIATTFDASGFVLHSAVEGSGSCEELERNFDDDNWVASPTDATLQVHLVMYASPPEDLESIDLGPNDQLSTFELFQAVSGESVSRGHLLRNRRGGGGVVDVWLLDEDYVKVGPGAADLDRVVVVPQATEVDAIEDWYDANVDPDGDYAVVDHENRPFFGSCSD